MRFIVLTLGLADYGQCAARSIISISACISNEEIDSQHRGYVSLFSFVSRLLPFIAVAVAIVVQFDFAPVTSEAAKIHICRSIICLSSKFH